jgi:hypothetical protein
MNVFKTSVDSWQGIVYLPWCRWGIIMLQFEKLVYYETALGAICE